MPKKNIKTPISPPSSTATPHNYMYTNNNRHRLYCTHFSAAPKLSVLAPTVHMHIYYIIYEHRNGHRGLWKECSPRLQITLRKLRKLLHRESEAVWHLICVVWCQKCKMGVYCRSDGTHKSPPCHKAPFLFLTPVHYLQTLKQNQGEVAMGFWTWVPGSIPAQTIS